MSDLESDLKKIIKGEVDTDEDTLKFFSHDASIFDVKPKIVVSPKDTSDVEAIIKYVTANKKKDPSLSITGRSAGTDMSGGPLNESIIVNFQKYFTKIGPIKDEVATVEPGVFYRDFEEETLKHHLIFPPYPASREICAMGGIINNNAGGEKSLEYGKTESYIESLNIVLADGKQHTVKALSGSQLENKLQKSDFEGQIYQKMYKLLDDNYEILQKAKPRVSKNSAGYYLWNVLDKSKKIFDLTKLICGAQGTLGLVTESSIKLVPTKRFSEMMIIFLKDTKKLGKIINKVLPLNPESFETYDDNTLKLAIKFFPEFARFLGTKNIIMTGWQFIPEFLMMITGGIPQIVLQVEFAGDQRHILNEKIQKLKESLKPFEVKTRVAPTKKAQKKYWTIRRESFNLLRHKIKDKHTVPFIDDFIVKPEKLSEFLPKLDAIFAKYPDLIYTIAGHMGDGNFHIIPLMDIQNQKQRDVIPKLGKEVYNLVFEYEGSTSGEHNDGIIRTPYVKQMFGAKIYSLFEETKKIFDPDNIFNPGKKVGGSIDYAMNHIRIEW